VKSLGFDTFEDLINHDYDKIIDPSCRFNAVIAELARLVDLIEADPVRFSNLIFDRARQNYYYAHSQHFLERYEEQVEASLRELLVKFF
jgi:exonuclease VII small subunit